VAINSSARACMPITRGSRCVPPVPAARPGLPPGKADLAAFLLGDTNIAGQRNLQASTHSMAVQSRNRPAWASVRDAKRVSLAVQAEIVLELRVSLW